MRPLPAGATVRSGCATLKTAGQGQPAQADLVPTDNDAQQDLL